MKIGDSNIPSSVSDSNGSNQSNQSADAQHQVKVDHQKKTKMDGANAAIDGINIQSLLHKPADEMTVAEQAIVKAIEKANKALEGVQTRLEYSVHKPSGTIMVKVLNKDTNRVIREIPPKKILDLVSALEHIYGVIIDEKR